MAIRGSSLERLQEFGPEGQKGGNLKCQNVRHLSKFRSNPPEFRLRAMWIASHAHLFDSLSEL
jgi:hypothetical protein